MKVPDKVKPFKMWQISDICERQWPIDSWIPEEIRSILHLWNACTNSVQNLFCLPICCSILQIRRYSTKIMNFIFCLPCILLWFLVNGQLDVQFFSMYLFQFSACFEQSRAHHQENQLYQYNRHRVTYTRGCVDTIDSPVDEHEVARNM